MDEDVRRKLQRDMDWLDRQLAQKYLGRETNMSYGDITPRTVQGSVEPTMKGVNIKRERIGHVEREGTLAHIADVTSRGYIKAEEAEARIKLVEQAEEQRELSAITADLPAPFQRTNWFQTFDWDKPKYWVPSLVLGMIFSALLAILPASVLSVEHLFPQTGAGLGFGITGLVFGVIGFFSCLGGIIAKSCD